MVRAAVRRLVSTDPFSSLADRIKEVQTSSLIIVDAAGSGKTNVCCRLALQLTHRCFCVFLTAGSYGIAFSDIHEYLNRLLITHFPDRSAEISRRTPSGYIVRDFHSCWC